MAARVLLTGATGFIGRHILERLMREDADIVAVNHNGDGPGAGRVTWRGADLRDAGGAVALLHEVKPTHLIHNAWIAVPGRFWTDPENRAWLAAGTAMAEAFEGEQFTGVGTCAEYDPGASAFVEDATQIVPNTLYGETKAAMWAAAEAASRLHGFTATWGRIFLPYGPGDSLKRLIPSVIAAIRSGERVALSAGTQQRDFIYAPDAADLIVALTLGGHAGAYNIGTGIGTTVRDAVTAVAARLGGVNLLDFGARPIPAHEPQRLVADMRKVERTLGWRAPTGLAAGLEALLDSQ